MRIHHISGILAIILATITLHSCGSSRNIASNSSNLSRAAAPLNQRFDALVQSYPQWQSLQVPATISIESPKHLSVSSRVTMVRDSLIHISLRMFGMELAIVHINNDSLFVVDKYHKYAFRESLRQVMSNYPVTLANVQDILLGRLFVAGNNNIDIADSSAFNFSGDKKSDIWFAFPKAQISGISWHFDIAGNPMVVKTLSFFHSQSDKSVSIAYSAPASTQAGYVPADINIFAPLSILNAEASLHFNLQSMSINRHNDFSWKCPDDYRTISIDNIKQMLSF